MKPLNEKEPLGPRDPSNIDDPRNFKAKDPQMLNKMNDPETGLKARQTAQNDAIATRMAKDTASSFGKSPPKSIPYMPDYKRINQQSISGPVTKANEENTMSLIHDKKTMSVADAVSKIMEAEKMAKKDHDQDGKIESGKDEYLGSRIRAAKAAGKLKEELKGNQHKIDANKNGKVDAHDFKLLRAKKTMKEEEQLDELSKSTVKSYVMKKMEKPTTTNKDVKGMTNAYNRLKGYKPTSEEVELDEAFPTVDDAKKRMNAGKTATGSLTKTKTGLTHNRDYKDDDTDDADDTQKKSKSYGARQNASDRGKSTGAKEPKKGEKLADTGVRQKPGRVIKTKTGLIHKMNESKLSFTEMLELYNEAGVEVINKIAPQTVKFGDTEVEVIDANIVNGAVGITVAEEVDNETFTKEVEAQKEKNAGRGKKAEVAKASVQAVKQEEYEQMDEADVYSIKNKKTGQIYHHSKYPITKNTQKFKQIKSAGGDHVHAEIHVNGKPIKEDIEQLDEKKKLPGLWANIHAKRKRGEAPAKPGDKDYPKTLNIEGVQDDPKADQMTTDDTKFPKKSRKAAIVKSAAKKMPPEDQFQAKPVLDSQVAQQTNK